LPEFRYFRDPHGSSNSTWTTDAEPCAFCGQSRPGYEGPYFGGDRVDFVCEPCLMSGRLAERDLTTNEGDIDGLRAQLDARAVDDVEGEVEERRRELEERTPRLVTWQDWWWPAHCGDFCRFVGETGQAELAELAPDGDGARFVASHLPVDEAPLEWGWVLPSLAGDEGYEVGVYLFQCLDCQAYVIRWDCA
jgi:uncharacterized protein CbrC (UPF0167 family)